MAKKRSASRKGAGSKGRPPAKKTAKPSSASAPKGGASGSSRSKPGASPGRWPATDRNESPRRRRVTLSIAALVSAALVFLMVIPKPAGTVSQAAQSAASAAGCTPLETPAAQAPEGSTFPGASYDYPDKPAASGPHDPSPLPFEPQVYDAPIPETRAVHNLEHAFVIVYYRQADPGSLPSDVVDRLKSLVESRGRTLMAPYTDLPSGVGLALLAWNKRWECPSTISPEQAATVASGFMDAYVGTGNAPEAPGRLHL